MCSTELDVSVNSGAPLEVALVEINDANNVDDSLNPSTGFSGTTNASGQISTQTLTGSMANRTSLVDFNNHTVRASKAGYVDSQSELNVTSDASLAMDLSPAGGSTTTLPAPYISGWYNIKVTAGAAWGSLWAYMDVPRC